MFQMPIIANLYFFFRYCPRQSDNTSKIEVRQRVAGSRLWLKPALTICCTLSLLGLLPVLAACGQTALRTSLVGNWIATNGVVKFADDGTLQSCFTNKSEVWAFEGTWLVRSNMLIMTTLKSNGVPRGVPRVDVGEFKIVRVNNDHLTYSMNGQTMTFVRKNSTALEKANELKLSTVKFDGLSLEVVITMLHDESVKRDPDRKGITISLAPNAKQLADAEIKLELKDVTLAETLERVGDSVGLKLQSTDAELLLVK